MYSMKNEYQHKRTTKIIHAFLSKKFSMPPSKYEKIKRGNSDNVQVLKTISLACSEFFSVLSRHDAGGIHPEDKYVRVLFQIDE